MLTTDMIDWLREPYTITVSEVEPGMVVYYEFGDFDNYIRTGVLMVEELDGDGSFRWHMYGERVTDPEIPSPRGDEATFDSSYSRGTDTVVIQGFFDVDEYYDVNPEVSF